MLIEVFLFFFNDPSTTELYTLSLHDALPILCGAHHTFRAAREKARAARARASRSEEHTSELQSRRDLVCRLLLEKKKRTAIPASVVAAGSGSRSKRPRPGRGRRHRAPPERRS